MSTSNYYEALGLAPNAAPEVIRAAYKALSLISHPDKTINFSPQDRAAHAARFSTIQAAYDLLSNPSLKAAYDAELTRPKKAANPGQSTSHRESSSRSSAGSFSLSKAGTLVKLTTPEEKSALRSKARHSIEQLRQMRAKRDVEEMHADVSSLRNMVQIWKDLADENMNDPAMLAQCTIRIHEYDQKVAKCEREHGEWLDNISKAKGSALAALSRQDSMSPSGAKKTTNFKTHPSKPTHFEARNGAQAASSNVPQPLVDHHTRVEQRKQAEADKAAAADERAEARAFERQRREASKQAYVEQKAAVVRAEKAKQQARAEEAAQKRAEHIANVRAKAGAGPLNTVGKLVKNEERGSNSQFASDEFQLEETQPRRLKLVQTKFAAAVPKSIKVFESGASVDLHLQPLTSMRPRLSFSRCK